MKKRAREGDEHQLFKSIRKLDKLNHDTILLNPWLELN